MIEVPAQPETPAPPVSRWMRLRAFVARVKIARAFVPLTVEVAGVVMLAISAWWAYHPAGLALFGAYLVYLSWDGGDHGDEG